MHRSHKEWKKKSLTFPLRTYIIPLCSKREKKIVSPQQISLCVFTNYCFELIFFCVALYLVDGPIAVHLTFALNGFFFVGIPVMWCEAPTKAYLIGISVSYRLTSQMSIIKFVFKISTLHNQNGNKSHVVEESQHLRKTCMRLWRVFHLSLMCVHQPQSPSFVIIVRCVSL